MGKSTTSNGWTDEFYTSAAYFSGGCLYEGSDENWKDFYEDIEVDFEKIRSIVKKYYSWKDDETKTRQIGVSAQSVQKVYPEIVSQDEEDGHLSVSYDRLGVIALAAIDKLNERIEELEKKLQ